MAEDLPKEFEKTTEVLPFTKYGLTSFDDFRKAEKEVQNLEWLKRIGLTTDEIKLYQDNEAGILDQRKKIDSTVLIKQLENIHKKIKEGQNEAESSKPPEEPSTSSLSILDKLPQKPINFYPEGHPMNDIKQLEQSLFGHLNNDILPISKRRKILRRLERRKERILAQGKLFIPTLDNTEKVSKQGSLWDVKETPATQQEIGDKVSERRPIIGPKKRTMYTIKDNKIVRLEPVNIEREDEEERAEGDIQRVQEERIQGEQYRAVDIVLPINPAEEQLLEGTKMSIDDIKKMDRFKDYEAGIPSKVLYLKNISPSVSLEQLSLLFNQFQLENGGPIDVRLFSGRMRGQAFVSFNSEELAIRALEEVNGTILSGKPVIVQFGRNTNRIQDDNR